jgi:hypothetical protein
MKWTDKTHIFIMHASYVITKSEIDFTAYRDHLYRKFIEKYPKTNVIAQPISDQCRGIVINKLLPPSILERTRPELAIGLND